MSVKFDPGFLKDVALTTTHVGPEPHADVVLTLGRTFEGLQPGTLAVIAGKNRRAGFPVQFPGMESYARGFGPIPTPAWFRANLPEYAGITFATYRTADDPLWDEVDVYGSIVPGTMLVQRPLREDIKPRIGIVISVRSTDDECGVMWSPWTFKEG